MKNILLITSILICSLMANAQLPSDVLLFMNEGNYYKALKYANGLELVYPGSLKTQITKCNLCVQLQKEALGLMASQSYLEAIEKYEEILAINPSDSNAKSKIKECEENISKSICVKGRQDTRSKFKASNQQFSVKVKASKIYMLDTAILEGEVGETMYLDYEVTPTEAKKNKVSWTSSNKNVAKVNPDGAIVAQGSGTTIITATVDNISRECKLEVCIKTNTTAKMYLSKTSLALKVGESYDLEAYNYGPTLKWESYNPNVATISTDGKITAVRKGCAHIWAKGNEYKRCVVNVVDQNSNEKSVLVKGKIVDSKGNPIVGAVIGVKGTTNFVMSLIDGTYSIKASIGDMLEFICKRYKSQEILVGNNLSINITMLKR